MKHLRIINILMSILLCMSLLTPLCVAAEENIQTIKISNGGNIREVPVLNENNDIYVSLDSILPLSDYSLNNSGNILYINNGLYHRMTIDHQNKSLTVGNYSWSFSDIKNQNGKYYFPLAEISAWLNLNLYLDNSNSGVLKVIKDPASLWEICNNNFFGDYHFSYTNEVGDNTASASLLFVSYLANTILDASSNWNRLVRGNLKDATVGDYETIFEKAIIEANDLSDIYEEGSVFVDFENELGTYFDFIFSYVKENGDLSKEFLNKISDVMGGSFDKISSLRMDEILDVCKYASNLSAMNEDYVDMLSVLYSNPPSNASSNECSAAKFVDNKYGSDIYSRISAVVVGDGMNLFKEGLVELTPAKWAVKAGDAVGLVVSSVFGKTFDLWENVALMPALTNTINTNMGIMNVAHNNAKRGNYSLTDNEKVRLSSILYLRLCRIGYEMMMNSGIGSDSYYRNIIKEIDTLIYKLHLARYSRENDSVDNKQAIVNEYKNLLKNITISNSNNSTLVIEEYDVGETQNSNTVLTRFNNLVDNVYRPGDIHFANDKRWPHGGIQCYGFAREIFYQLFNKTFSDLDTTKYYVFREDQADINNVSVVGQLLGSQINYDNIKNMLSKAKVGDVIQMVNGANKLRHHTMIVGRYIYDDGLEIYENNWSPYLTELSKHTWRGICDYTGNYTASGITLYRASNYDAIGGNIISTNVNNIPQNEKDSNADNTVTFSDIYVKNNSTNLLDVTFYCDTVKSNRIGEFSEWGITVYENGKAISTSKDTGVTWVENHLAMNFNSKKYGINLKENTDYTFIFYVVFDGKTYQSESTSYRITNKSAELSQNTVSVSLSNQYVSQIGNDPTDITFYCDTVKSNRIGEFSEWGLTVYENGSEITTVRDTGTTWVEDHMYLNFNSKKYGINLKEGKNYTYRFYVVFDGTTYYGDIQSYKVGEISAPPQPQQPQQTSVVFSGHNVVTNSDDPTDVTFRCEDIRANHIGDITEWGLTVWDSSGNEIKTVNDTGTTWYETHLTAWYGAKKNNINLQSGADYTYRFYVVFDGVTYYGDIQSYKVGEISAPPQPQQPQQTSVVFSGHNVVTNSDDPTDVTFRCEDIRANHIGDITEWGLTVWDSSGNEIKTVNDTGTTWYETHLTAWYGAKKNNINLQSGADYTYRFYVVFDGVTYYGDIQSYSVG